MICRRTHLVGPNYNMPVETPIKNVFNVGDAVCAPESVEPQDALRAPRG